MQQEAGIWRRCSSCKKPIGLKQKYFVCSVSTCNGLRTGYVFCSVPCFETHLPGARHRDAAAIEQLAPAVPAAAELGSEMSSASTTQSSGASVPQRRIISSAPVGHQVSGKSPAPKEILIVASKLKDYIRVRSDMNTSADVMNRLSDIVRRLCDDAIDRARADGRKTVMDRDF